MKIGLLHQLKIATIAGNDIIGGDFPLQLGMRNVQERMHLPRPE